MNLTLPPGSYRMIVIVALADNSQAHVAFTRVHADGRVTRRRSYDLSIDSPSIGRLQNAVWAHRYHHPHHDLSPTLGLLGWLYAYTEDE